MNSSNVKTLVIVFALLISTGLICTGCKQATKHGAAWVNTDSMPGKVAASLGSNGERAKNTAVVYLGDQYESKEKFGPQDVNFDFNSLKR